MRIAVKSTVLSFFAVVFFATLPLAAQSDPAWKSKLSRSVFEVVVAKPSTDSLTYEEKLPFELLPFSERNDTQFSIGTAFYIGQGRFVSAAHVFSLDELTLLSAYAVRDSSGKIYPVGRVLAYSNRRDFIVFEVPGLSADALAISTDYQLNGSVYTVGNAFGEGVVVRDGLLTSMTPEDRDGEWKWLRFSAPASPGNSGGPLIDSSGKVIGIVAMKSQNENLNYALPISELDLKPVGIYDIRNRYQLPNVIKDAPFVASTSFPLPLSVDDMRTKLSDVFKTAMVQAGEQITKQNPASLFPRVDGSQPVLGDSYFTMFPLFIGQKADGTWQSQGPDKPASAQIGDDGSLSFGDFWGYSVLSYIRPTAIRESDLFDHPKVLLDSILKGYFLSRNIAGKQIRITSFGDPAWTESFQDNYGRRWLIARFDAAFADSSQLLMVMPTPSGAVGLLIRTGFADWPAYNFDMHFLANYVFVSYEASLKDWKEFLASPRLRPSILDNFAMNYSPGKSFSLDTPRMTLNFDTSLMSISDDTILALMPAYSKEGSSYVWDIARTYIQESGSGKAYFTVEKRFKPDVKASDQSKKSWASINKDLYPYNSKPFAGDGVTSIYASRHPSSGGQVIDDPAYVYGIGFNMEGDVTDADLQARFRLLQKGFALKSREETLASNGQSGTTVSAAPAASPAAVAAPTPAASGTSATPAEPVPSTGDLVAAIVKGKTDLVLQMADKEADLSAVDANGWSILMYALRYADDATALALIQKGAAYKNANKDGWTPLHFAARYGKTQSALALISFGDFDMDALSTAGKTPIMLAAQYDQVPVVAKLLDAAAADPRAQDADGWDSLMLALRYGSDADVRAIAAKIPGDANVNKDGWTILHVAARYKPALLSELSTLAPGIDTQTARGWTALSLAAASGNIDAVKFLVQSGADAAIKNADGKTALELATAAGKTDLAAYLSAIPKP